ncbi:MAG: ECF transporter S component [Lachnospiraceae bacterium]|nr:ECF transporter S component [Lachnospiraceae bacterium]
MNDLFMSLKENVTFVLEFLGLVVLMFVIAYVAQKIARKKENASGRILSTRTMAVTGMFSAISAILMILEIPVFFAPSFYKFDFSELPALIGAFAFGPVAGVMIEFIKIVIKCLFKGTSTAFVGELANFVIGCSLILPASIIYLFRKNKKTAIAGCITGTLIMTVVGSVFNAVYLLPKFAQMFGMPLEAIVEMATAINPKITSISGLVIMAVAPLNLLKGGAVSLITILIYKKISGILKGSHN